MKFARLRLVGFKSFVEPTELVIEPGLTGIVGPNGCGKSNLLEALRWVMGENSHKNMRASGMEDVIFAGTTQRPPRNAADVTLVLDNSDRTAPPGFNNDDTIEVSRRIERDGGSTYRLNGREVRARDVQLLFADASTGARSPALVRQGQVSELINAKPVQRRRILEEAAGITGLDTRRHEAELRLNSAEANLARLDDIVGQLESQLSSLRRQARHAQRYKLLSAEIRRLEAAHLYRQWLEARDAASREEEALRQASAALAAAARAHADAERDREAAEQAVPALRDAVTVRAAVVQKLRHEQAELAAEEARAQSRKAELRALLAQIDQDLRREDEILVDGRSVLERLDEEEQSIRLSETLDETVLERAAEALGRATEELAAAQDQADAAQLVHSECVARREAAERSVAELSARVERLEREEQAAQARLASLEGSEDDVRATALLQEALAGITARIEAAEQSLRELEKDIAEARQDEAGKRSEHEAARRRADTLSAEVRTLTKLLKVADGELWPPMIDQVRVEAGFEQALAAAFGEDLDAAADRAAPSHWAELPPIEDMPPLPEGAESLSAHVRGPEALVRSLSAIGVVEAQDGARLQLALAAGQRLVSRQGDLWRWDGFTVRANAPSPAAVRLAERNRLEGLSRDAQAAEAEAEARRAELEAVRSRLDALVKREKAEREAVRELRREAELKRSDVTAREKRMAEWEARRLSLQQSVERLRHDHEEAAALHAARMEELQSIEKPDALRQALDAARMALSEKRIAHAEARARHESLSREIALRTQRLERVQRERKAWSERLEKATKQREVLSGRAREAQAALDQLNAGPDDIEARRRRLSISLTDAERQEADAQADLSAAEKALKDAEATVRQASELQSQAREAHARCEAVVENARTRLGESLQRLRDELEADPDAALRIAGHDSVDSLPPQGQITSKLNSLKTDRERLGGVNLRAEDEAREIEAKLDELVAERNDVIEAVQKLRQAIQNLNREGRQRLLEAFDVVNANFRDLFTTLFGGGSAELSLVESDDPLQAGLEIIATPPGKRSQVLSLLSGGEQALTAVALIFAVFLTNPSPICVMDEVDAPLDDANVERFCNLLDVMLEKAETRFLVITHHPLTMARMHRLFGVTMMERGVSQLVSVDLQAAEALREAV
jgi:chromosome segregation protein